MKFFSESFIGGLKRQAFIKALDLLIDALIDFKQTYQNRTATTKQGTPETNLTNHL